ncbi:pyridoxamine 5'-phosphate oxidase family protein [Microbacterium sp.]|uniref:pyridoxamine 5'-phosphate oxidase family protein n=1 Tax=Microbacterium sp. TaxID=51671 RepID=UPI002D771009|nr:pyridoxamine 5'-phosphate oxidase family protein [Microbacterium sp.]HET6301067.1 pyridoxamine 5'-phosphate oxidase family protein [Microbacterium sp.]
MTTSTHLSTAECWELLERERVGRLAVLEEGVGPDIFPVNFVAYQGAIYIRSAPDVKVVRLAAQPAAAFEVDGHDKYGWWSVVVRGTAARVTDAVEIERSGIRHVVTASPRYKQHVLKITPRTTAGRRFADRSGIAIPHADPTPTAPIELPDPSQVTDAASEQTRSTRPVEIPSHPPLPEGTAPYTPSG